MKKRLLVGIVILGIGVGSTYVAVKNFYKFYTYNPPPMLAYNKDRSLELKDYLEKKEIKRNVCSPRVAGPSAPMSTSSKRRVQTSAPNRKITRPQEKKEDAAEPLQKVMPVAAPIVEKPLFKAKLVAYLDVEKILSWLANIITIITGVLIILRKRDDPL